MSKFIQVGSPPLAYYNDILMRANPELHAQAFACLNRFAASGATVVDLGSGQGAFAARLSDCGYHVLSVDKNQDDFQATGVPFLAVDFDVPNQLEAFRTRFFEHFDVAVGMEVIEHVENPWEYFRLMLSLTRPGGIVMLTTPNTESVFSRIQFLCSGVFSHFTASDFIQSGHINPLTFHELALIAKHVGAEVLDFRSICPLPWIIISRRPSVVSSSFLASIVRPFAGQRGSGDIICMIMRKPD